MKKFYQTLIFAFTFIIFTVAGAHAQTRGTVKGKVVTSDGKSADNVSVMLKGAKYGTVTTQNGEFLFRAPEGSYTLSVSSIGAQGIEIPVTVTGNQTVSVPTVTINTSMAQLDAVNISTNRANRIIRKQSADVGKMPLNTLENAQVYTTISSELLKEQQVFSIDDALRNSPGIQRLWEATGRAGDGGGYYSLRGFTVQSGVRNGVAGNVTGTIDASNIERIEVIKGPSATLFGSTLTSYGGLINRVTKKPFEEFKAEITHTVGNFDLSRTSIDINTPIDKQKKLMFRINSAYNYEGSFQNNGFARTFAATPSLLYKPTEKLSISLEAETFFGRNSAKPFFFFPFGVKISDIGYSRADQLPIDYRQSYNNDNITQRTRSVNYIGQVNYKISDQWNSQTNLTSSSSFSNGNSPYYYLLPGNLISREDQSTRNSKSHVYEIQQNFNGDFKIGEMRNRLVVGLDYLRVDNDQHFFSTIFDQVNVTQTNDYSNFNRYTLEQRYAAAPGTEYPFVGITNTYSAYASDVLNITDRLIASAALRVDRFNNKGNYSQTAFSPKFGLIYQPVKDMVSIFANYQNGFSNRNGQDKDGTKFTPEHANQMEGGVKLNTADGKITGTLSYYNIKVDDIVRTDPTNPNFSIQNGTQKSQGLEAEFVANPINGMNVVAGFSYNKSVIEQATADVEGLRPTTAGSPYLANLWVSYRFQQPALKGVGLGFGGNYASDNKVINSNTVGVFTLPSYTILNASAFYEKAGYRFGLTANNFANKKYYTGYTTVNPQRLRQFLLTAAYRF
jgi:iron complex outermembrane receptor protein